MGGGWRTPASLLALSLWYPAYHTLQVGQVNAFVFAALVLALWGLLHRRDATTGAGLALGAALKITPLALLAYLLWQRRWRAAAATLLGLLAIVILLLPLTGVETYAHYAAKAYGLTRPTDVSVGPGIDGVRAFLGRLLLPTSETTSSPAAAAVAEAASAVVAAMAALSAALLWRRRPRDDLLDGQAAPLEFALLVALSLVSTPLPTTTSTCWR